MFFFGLKQHYCLLWRPIDELIRSVILDRTDYRIVILVRVHNQWKSVLQCGVSTYYNIFEFIFESRWSTVFAFNFHLNFLSPLHLCEIFIFDCLYKFILIYASFLFVFGPNFETWLFSTNRSCIDCYWWLDRDYLKCFGISTALWEDVHGWKLDHLLSLWYLIGKGQRWFNWRDWSNFASGLHKNIKRCLSCSYL